MKGKDVRTVFQYLRNRELGFCASIPRNDYKLFKSLMLSDTRIYEKKEDYVGMTAMFFEADRIYCNHYRRAYSAIDRTLIYDLELTLFNEQSKERIVDSDIFYLTSTHEPHAILCSELLVGLTDFHRLLVLNATTGKLIKQFQLPKKEQGYKFSELGIGKDNETMYVKGRRMSIPPTRQPHFVFVMFDLIPFRCRYTVALCENVIGPFVNVMISQDLVIFVHSGSVLKFYSLETMLFHANEKFDSDSHKDDQITLGLDASIDWPCPCLYSVRVTSDLLEMGGFPWHCLYKPPKQSIYRLQSLANDSLVQLDNGQLHQNEPGQGMEVNVFFNPDESGSVIHVLQQEIKKFAIVSSAATNQLFSLDCHHLKELWSLSVGTTLKPGEDIFYTASGRKASRLSWTGGDDLCYIDCVQYLSTIDALCVVLYYEDPAAQTRKRDYGGESKLLIVDNKNGRIRKEILLDEPWNTVCEEHQVELDDDILVHSIKHRTGKHSCHVYRLSERIEEEAGAGLKSSKLFRRKNDARHSKAQKRRRTCV